MAREDHRVVHPIPTAAQFHGSAPGRQRSLTPRLGDLSLAHTPTDGAEHEIDARANR